MVKISKTSKRAKPLPNYKMKEGKPIIPTMYIGSFLGHGRYMAGDWNGKLLTDRSGKPIPYSLLMYPNRQEGVV